ncbi:hypothetical protein MPTK2_Ug00080 [Marchantia polymorpha subsp. ruderalis]
MSTANVGLEISGVTVDHHTVPMHAWVRSSLPSSPLLNSKHEVFNVVCHVYAHTVHIAAVSRPAQTTRHSRRACLALRIDPLIFCLFLMNEDY